MDMQINAKLLKNCFISTSRINSRSSIPMKDHNLKTIHMTAKNNVNNTSYMT